MIRLKNKLKEETAKVFKQKSVIEYAKKRVLKEDMTLKSNIDQKWKTADDMAGDMQQWLTSVYSRGYTPNQGPAIYDKVMNVLSNLVDNFDPINEAQKVKSLYKDWDQFEKPSKIQVYLNNGKTLEISPLKLKGGKRVYDAILQAFIDDRFDITNKVVFNILKRES